MIMDRHQDLRDCLASEAYRAASHEMAVLNGEGYFCIALSNGVV